MAITRKRLTVDQYEQMAVDGDLTEDDRVELIEGEIIAMSPVGSRHFECVTTLLELIIDRKPDTVRVTMQNPIRLLDESEPEPDLTIMRAKRYWRRIPTVSDESRRCLMCLSSLKYRTAPAPTTTARRCRSVRARVSRNCGSWI